MRDFLEIVRNPMKAPIYLFCRPEAAGQLETLAKAHISAYTRKDGTYVQEHEDSRQAAAPKQPVMRAPKLNSVEHTPHPHSGFVPGQHVKIPHPDDTKTQTVGVYVGQSGGKSVVHNKALGNMLVENDHVQHSGGVPGPGSAAAYAKILEGWKQQHGQNSSGEAAGKQEQPAAQEAKPAAGDAGAAKPAAPKKKLMPASAAKLDKIDASKVTAWMDRIKSHGQLGDGYGHLGEFLRHMDDKSKDTFLKWFNAHRKTANSGGNGNTNIYLAGALGTVFGRRNQVLMKDGTWRHVPDLMASGRGNDVVTDAEKVKQAAIAEEMKKHGYSSDGGADPWQHAVNRMDDYRKNGGEVMHKLNRSDFKHLHKQDNKIDPSELEGSGLKEFDESEVYTRSNSTFSPDFDHKNNKAFIIRHSDGKRSLVDTQGHNYARYAAPIADGGNKPTAGDAGAAGKSAADRLKEHEDKYWHSSGSQPISMAEHVAKLSSDPEERKILLDSERATKIAHLAGESDYHQHAALVHKAAAKRAKNDVIRAYHEKHANQHDIIASMLRESEAKNKPTADGGNKKIPASSVDVRGDDHYQFTHGKKPSGRGMWFFSPHKSHDFGKHGDKAGEHFFLSQSGTSYSEAKEQAKKWAAEKGHSVIHVQT